MESEVRTRRKAGAMGCQATWRIETEVEGEKRTRGSRRDREGGVGSGERSIRVGEHNAKMDVAGKT